MPGAIDLSRFSDVPDGVNATQVLEAVEQRVVRGAGFLIQREIDIDHTAIPRGSRIRGGLFRRHHRARGRRRIEQYAEDWPSGDPLLPSGAPQSTLGGCSGVDQHRPPCVRFQDALLEIAQIHAATLALRDDQV